MSVCAHLHPSASTFADPVARPGIALGNGGLQAPRGAMEERAMGTPVSPPIGSLDERARLRIIGKAGTALATALSGRVCPALDSARSSR